MRHTESLSSIAAYIAIVALSVVINTEAQDESERTTNSDDAYQYVAECSATSTDREKEICRKVDAASAAEIGEGVTIWYKGDPAVMESELDSMPNHLDAVKK